MFGVSWHKKFKCPEPLRFTTCDYFAESGAGRFLKPFTEMEVTPPKNLRPSSSSLEANFNEKGHGGTSEKAGKIGKAKKWKTVELKDELLAA